MLRAVSQLDRVLSGLIVNQLPAALAQALMAALAQAPAEGKGICGRCSLRRAEWDLRNDDAIQFALDRALEAAGVTRDDPAAGDVSIFEFLPEDSAVPKKHPATAGRRPRSSF